jgi:hypothetical protein
LNDAVRGLLPLNPEGQITLQLLGINQRFSIIIEVQFQFQGGEKSLHHRVVPATAFGGHAADEFLLLEQLPLDVGPILATMIGVDQQVIGTHLAMTEGEVKGLDHQGCIHLLIQRPSDDVAAEQPAETEHLVITGQ